jgi:hypothetical protein
MDINSTTPTSRRGYLSQDELEQFANISVTDIDEADDVISQAEELIDAYVGFQDKFYEGELMGKASSASATSITLQTNQLTSFNKDFFKGMEVEIVGGAGAGERRGITASTGSGVLTVNEFSTDLDETSIYRIYQLGKFPRKEDVFYDSNSGDNVYYKSIPEAVKRAVASQVEYIIEMGDELFKTDKLAFKSERIGDYAYEKEAGSYIDSLLSPKSKILLRGITNRKGVIII